MKRRAKEEEEVFGGVGGDDFKACPTKGRDKIEGERNAQGVFVSASN